MGRPTADIINEIPKNGKMIQIIKATGLWSVFYKGEPMNIKQTAPQNYPGANNPKYPKTTFPGPGHANALARRMNKLFGCEDFTVVQILGEELTITIHALDADSVAEALKNGGLNEQI